MATASLAQERQFIAILAGMALAAVIVALVSTRWGVGVSPDSVTYIGSARNVLTGGGLNLPFGEEELVRLNTTQHRPPLFPVLLAIIGALGMDPSHGARWLNALLFGANTFLTGYAVYRYTHSRLAATLGTFLMISSVDMLLVHTTAWTEPLFIFFELAALILLASYIEHGTSVAIASIPIGLAFFTRYPGIALIITGLTGVLLLRRAGYREKARDSFVLLTISCLPMVLWIARGLYVARNAVGREIVLNPVSYRHIAPTLHTLLSWLVPPRIPGVAPFVRSTLLLVIVTLALLALILLMVQRRRAAWHNPGTHGFEALPTCSMFFIAAYVLVLVVSVATLSDIWFYGIGGRLLSPVYVALLIVSLCFGHRALRSSADGRTLMAATIALGVVLAGSYAVRGAAFVVRRYNEGAGYSHRLWRQSETIEWIKTLPPGVHLYSNGPDAIYFLTGRAAVPVPWKVDWKVDRAGAGAAPDFSFRLDQMADRLREGRSFLVLFHAINWRWYLPSEDELTSLLPLTLVTRKSDGSVYEIRPVR